MICDCVGQSGAVEIIFRGKNVEEETAKYEHKFTNPLVAALVVYHPITPLYTPITPL